MIYAIDMLALTDSRITARRVTQDELRCRQLPDRVWAWRGRELSFREDGCDAVVGGCACGWDVAAGLNWEGDLSSLPQRPPSLALVRLF